MSLLSQPLIVVGGKGGVGRSTVAAGLACALAQEGKRVLAVDPLGAGGLARALSRSDRSSSQGSASERTPHLEPGFPISMSCDGVEISVLELSTESSLAEYVERFVPLPGASSRVLGLGPIARMFDYVSKAAPAVKEILTIGKIGFEVRERNWDVVVVDGPATGHLIEVLGAPQAVSELVDVGPLTEQTQWLTELLSEPSVTAAVLVTTAEELPVSELIELNGRLLAETQTNVAAVVVNRTPPTISAKGEREASALVDAGSPLAAAVEVLNKRAERRQAQQIRLEDLGLPLIQVPESNSPRRAVGVAVQEVLENASEDAGDEEE